MRHARGWPRAMHAIGSRRGRAVVAALARARSASRSAVPSPRRRRVGRAADRRRRPPSGESRRQRAAAAAADAGGGRREERRLPLLPRRHRADARLASGEARLHRLPRRRRRRSARPARSAGSRAYTAAQRAAHVAPRHPEKCWRDPSDPTRMQLRQPGAQLHAAEPRVARVRPLHQPRRPARRRTRPAARCHANEVASGRAQPDDHGGDAVGRRRLQQRHRRRSSATSSASPTAGRRAAEDQHRAAADRRGDRRRASCRSCVPLPPLEHGAAARPASAPSSAAARIDRSVVSEVGNPNLGPFLDEPGKPDMKLGTAASAPISASAPASSTSTRRASTTRTCRSSAPTTIPATTARAAAPRATSSTPTIAIRSHSGPYAAVRPHGHLPRQRPDDPQGRARPPDRAPPHARDPDQPVHGLPHAPAELVPEHLPRLPDVGLRDRRRAAVAEGAALPDRRRADAVQRSRSSRCTQPRPQPEEAAARGLWTDPDFLDDVSDLNPSQADQFADYHGHGWVFRAVYKQDRKGNLLDKDGHIVRSERSGEVRQGRPPEGHPPREGDALRRLPLRAGRPRRRPALRRDPNAIEIQCLDCHGTVSTCAPRCAPAGPAAPTGGNDLLAGIDALRANAASSGSAAS